MRILIPLLLVICPCVPAFGGGGVDASKVLYETLLSFDPQLAVTPPHDLPSFCAKGRVIRTDGGFHYSVEGDRFEELVAFMTKLYGPPITSGVSADDEAKHARFPKFTVVSVPKRSETVIFSLDRRLPEPPSDGDWPVRVINGDDVGFDVYGRPDGEGWVDVGFTVDYYGRTSDWKILASSDPAFEAAALSCMKRMQFQPAFRNGRPIKVAVKQKIRFPAREVPEEKPEEKKRRTRRYRQPR